MVLSRMLLKSSRVEMRWMHGRLSGDGNEEDWIGLDRKRKEGRVDEDETMNKNERSYLSS